MIYLDNAATTLNKPKEVLEAVYDAMLTIGNAGRGVHDASLASLRMVTETRELLAELFHFPHPNRVCFTANATESLNLALRGIFEPAYMAQQDCIAVKRPHVITTVMEHNSVLRPLYRLEQEKKITLTILGADKTGTISYCEFERAIRPETRAVVCAHASNLTGNVMDLNWIGALTRRHKLLFVVDAAQTAGILPIDMEKMNIDILCFTGHKGLMGPQGTGGICVQQNVMIAPLKTGGSGIRSYEKIHPSVFPEALEAGTLNTHGIAGLHAALLYLKRMGISRIQEQEQELTRTFYQGIKDLPGVKVYGSFSDEVHAGIVSINIGDYDSSQVSDELIERYEIATRPGAHCAPLAHMTLGTVEQGAVRFSFSHRNTKKEVEKAVHAVKILATE